MDRILVMDVGNTNTALGVYEGTRLQHHWRISTVLHRTSDELGLLIQGLCRSEGFDDRTLDGIMIGSVVPPCMNALEEMCRRCLGCAPLVVGPGIKTGLVIQYDNPRDVGADRIANAVAALHDYEPPLIVVDFGTATTFCVLDAAGKYIGGAIAPGVMIATEALVNRTAKLPRIELVRPKQVIAHSTVTSMQSGVVYGFAGQVDGLVERMRQEAGLPFRVIATGGSAEMIAPASKTIQHIAPNLTMDGLRLLWERNR